jgi:hypothetical protein
MSENQVQIIVARSEKSPGLGAALSFFFGCLGLLYSSPKAALIMFLPYVISAALIPFLVGIPMLIVCNIISCVWAYKACEKHNRELHSGPTLQKPTSIKAA